MRTRLLLGLMCLALGVLPVRLAVQSVAAAEPARDALLPGLVSYQAPQFPAELNGSGVLDGYATVAYLVDAQGLIVDAVIVEATHRSFADAVTAVLPNWRFAPVELAKPWPRREVLRIEFANKGVVTALSHRDATKAAFPISANERLPIRMLAYDPARTLPKRVTTATPKPTAGVKGKVAVSYVIDSAGRVRVPAIVEATHPALAQAVLAAVQQWRYEPPLDADVPVLIEDLRGFSFHFKT